MEDRRKSMRIPVATIAHITPHGLQKSREIFIRELSTEGMGCYVDQCCQEGDMILTKIKLDVPGTDSGVIQSSLMGRIIWVKQLNEEQISEEKKFAIGVEFREMETRNPNLYAHLKEIEKRTHAEASESLLAQHFQ